MLNIFPELKYPKWFTGTLKNLINGQFRISAHGRIIFTKIKKTHRVLYYEIRAHSSRFFCEKYRRILIVKAPIK